MSRQLIGRTLVRLYPAEVRRARGNELVGTLLDAGEVSMSAFLANAASLAGAGLWARACAELRRPIGQLLVGALCWAAVLGAMTELVEGVGTALFWGGTIFSFGSDPQTIIDMYVLPVLILVAVSGGRNRTAGLLGLLRVVMRLHQSQLISLDDFLIGYPVQIAGFALLAFRPRTILPAGRYLWPIPTALCAFYWLTLLGQHSGVGRMTPVIAMLVFLPVAPSLALGLGIDWLLQGLFYFADFGGGVPVPPVAWEFLGCLPVVLIAVGLYRRVAIQATRAG